MIINRKAFADAVGHAMLAVPLRPTMPVLSAVKMESRDGLLTISGFDFNTQATAAVPADEDLELTLVNGALLKEVASKSKAQNMSLDVEDNQLKIKAGRAKVTIPTMPASEYPAPLVTPDSGFTIDGTGWASLARSVAYAASKDDTILILGAVHFVASDGQLTAQATDRYRLSENIVAIEGDYTGSFLVSAKTVTEISRHLDTAATWQVRISDGTVAVTDGSAQIIRSLIDGDYPTMERLFPTTVEHQATVDRDELSGAISRATSMLERNTPVKLTIESDIITVNAGAADKGAMTEQVDCTGYDGSGITIGYNPIYLTEALDAVSSDEAVLGFNDARKPSTISGDDPEHRQMVMPVRINN